MLEPFLRKLGQNYECIIVPKLAEPEDRYHLEQTSNLEPALGHTFDHQLECECRRTWEEHQKEPLLCPLLIERLNNLTYVEAQLRALRERANDRERYLKNQTNKEREAHLNTKRRIINLLKAACCNEGDKTR